MKVGRRGQLQAVNRSKNDRMRNETSNVYLIYTLALVAGRKLSQLRFAVAYAVAARCGSDASRFRRGGQ